jgi:predicted HTH domain antitoxin
MGVIIPDEILQAAHLKDTELLQVVALLLYEQERLTLGQASKLARMSQLQFQHLLGSRQMTIHYDVSDYEEDVQTMRRLGRI